MIAAGGSPRLVKAPWPAVGDFSQAAEHIFPKLQEIVGAIRAVRNEHKVDPKKPVTVNYPYQKVPVFPKYRGKQVLMRDENGLEKCVACGLCSVACPADAIYLEAAENDGTVMAGPRYASVYQIHKTRCIFCGMCEEACPVSAIFMGKDYELAVYSKDDFVWDKADLLVAPPANSRAPLANLPSSVQG